VVIAVVAMGMVQMTVHQVVHVIAMRHGLVAAAWAMHVVGGVPGALVLGRAALRVCAAYR